MSRSRTDRQIERQLRIFWEAPWGAEDDVLPLLEQCARYGPFEAALMRVIHATGQPRRAAIKIVRRIQEQTWGLRRIHRWPYTTWWESEQLVCRVILAPAASRSTGRGRSPASWGPASSQKAQAR
jgi:hypothetical protein